MIPSDPSEYSPQNNPYLNDPVQMTPLIKEVLLLNWSDFVAKERDYAHNTSLQQIVYAFIRACQYGKLSAIKETLDRIDGKVPIQISIQYPQFYFLYPYADTPADSPTSQLPSPSTPSTPSDPPPPRPPRRPMHSLRDVLERMLQESVRLPSDILTAASQIEDDPPPHHSDPLVRAVIVAGLVRAAHRGDFPSIAEILDRIDGRVTEQITLLGDDVYITMYDKIAPPGATLNQDGIYQIQASNTTNQWATSLDRLTS